MLPINCNRIGSVYTDCGITFHPNKINQTLIVSYVATFEKQKKKDLPVNMHGNAGKKTNAIQDHDNAAN